VVTVFKYFMMAAYNGHWAACIFYELAKAHDFDETTWVYNNSFGLQNERIATQYTTSLYWSITTLTTVGYGDISPQNDDERAFVIIYMMINLGLTSYLIGNTTALISKPDTEQAQLREYMHDLRKYLKKTGVPVELQKKALGFVVNQKQLKLQKGNDAMCRLPAAIRNPIRDCQYKGYLDQLDIFKDTSPEFSQRLLAHVKEVMFSEHETILQFGQYGGDFYIIKSGQAMLKIRETERNSARPDIDKISARNKRLEERPVGICLKNGHFGAEGFFASVGEPFTVEVMGRTKGKRGKPLIALKVEKSFREELKTVLGQDLQIILRNMSTRLKRISRAVRKGIRIRQRKAKNSPDGEDSAAYSDSAKVSMMSEHGSRPQRQSDELKDRVTADSKGSPIIVEMTEMRKEESAKREGKQSLKRPLVNSSVGKEDVQLGNDDKNHTPHLRDRKSSSSSRTEDMDTTLYGGNFQVKEDNSRHSFLRITEFWQPFVVHANRVAEEVDIYKERHEHDMSSVLCHLAKIKGGHEKLQLTINGRDLSNDEGDYDGRVPLHLAAANGNLASCKILLAARADPSHEDNSGRTPILEAIEANHEDIARFLLKKGGSLKLKNQGEYLCNAAAAGNEELLALLCIARVNLDAGDYDKRTALHLAAAEGKLSIVRLLVERKATPDIKDRWDDTPLDSAKIGNYTSVIQYLEKLTPNKARRAVHGLSVTFCSSVKSPPGSPTNKPKKLEIKE